MTDGRLHAELAAQTEARLVHPVYFGSAMTGAGVDQLMTGIVDLLPKAPATPRGHQRARCSRSDAGRAARSWRSSACSTGR